jgi:hypothetical protein
MKTLEFVNSFHFKQFESWTVCDEKSNTEMDSILLLFLKKYLNTSFLYALLFVQ